MSTFRFAGLTGSCLVMVACGLGESPDAVAADSLEMVCEMREMSVGEITAGGGGFPTMQAAARDFMSADLARGGLLVRLPDGQFSYGVARGGELVAKVGLVELADGTWLVGSSERCVE